MFRFTKCLPRKYIRVFTLAHAGSRNLCVDAGILHKQICTIPSLALNGSDLWRRRHNSSTNCYSFRQLSSRMDNLASSQTSIDDFIVETVSGTMEKSIHDNRDYLAFTLPNSKLRCVCVHDPNTKQAAAAMNVHVGSFSDPWSIPGMAHFVEHLLFLGTAKYPAENDFASYLHANGGHSNAYTSSEDTLYHFNVNSEALEGALDRFCWFFRENGPSFAKESIARELNAVDSEHSKNLNSDNFRMYQVSD